MSAHINNDFRKQVLREFPELAAGYHLPVMAEVVQISDAPTQGGINDAYRPRLAVDVQLLQQDYQATGITLDAVPVAIYGGGQERGFFALPQPGTLVELAWLNGSPERPFVRSILGDRQALPWLDEHAMSWQQSETVKQTVDRHGHWQRTTASTITDQAHTKINDLVKRVDNIGTDIKQVLEHSSETVDGKKVTEAGAIHQLSASVLNLLALGSINQVSGAQITRNAAQQIIDQASGDMIQTIGGDWTATIKGDLSFTAKGNTTLKGHKLFIGHDQNVLSLLSDVLQQ